MSFINSQIILSGVDFVLNDNNLRKCGVSVTHILTVDSTPLPNQITDNFETKFVQCDDCETVDLLHKFKECIEFINAAVSKVNNIVVIHCHAGQSRSVCIVAAYLMKTLRITLSDAEDLIRSKHPEISLNPGFVHQLLLFEIMKCEIDESHPGYIHYKLQCFKNQIEVAGIEQITLQKLATFQRDATSYKCRKCRKTLFGKNNIYPHTANLEKAFFTKFEDCDQFQKLRNKCSSMFLEPMKWMQKDIIGNLTGKIMCPHCRDKLGKFNWYGSQCSCGKWVTPSLQIHSNKLDIA